MIRVGLTGSIGMGKTTTCAMFKDLGASIFDADAAVHRLYSKGGAAVPILRAGIPESIIDGAVDRAVLSKALEKDPALFSVLESFIHPLVSSLRHAAMKTANADGVEVFINDVPLLFETAMDEHLDKTIVVTCEAHIQRARVLARPNMSKEKFESILARQMPDAQKRARADYIIHTDQGMDITRKHVQKIMQDLIEIDQKKRA